MTVPIRTRVRTWLFVAALTALLLSVGAMLGGIFMFLFAGVAVVMNAVGYWWSDRIALAASRARPMAEADAPAVHAMVRDLSRRAAIPVPRLYLIDSAQPNAFATGRSPAHSAVAVTRGLLDLMPTDEVRAVLAHELAHIRNRDVRVSAIAAMVAGAIAAIANVLQFSMLFGGGDDDDGALGWLGTLGAILIAPIAAAMLQLAISRQREFLADATAARFLGDGTSLADALERLEVKAQSTPPLAINQAFASLYISNPLGRGGMAGLFSTHPPVSERVRRLRAYDRDREPALQPSPVRS
jgi:heat shock protein HtpX